jgi:DNA-binding transcriptional LysR family regulator
MRATTKRAHRESSREPNVDLRQLRYFVAVATELNFSRAAERLHISQPPLSQQIKHLEEELGVQLLLRNSRAVELTAIGKLFLEEARETLERAERAVATARRAAAGEVGSIVVATMSTADILVFPRIVPAFQKRFPAVQLTFLHMSEVELAVALEDGRVNVGFATLPVVTRGDCVAESIYREPMVAALPSSHRLAGEASIEIEALSEDDWVLPDPLRTPSSHFTVMSLCAARGFVPRAVQYCDNVQFMLSLISADLAVAVLPERVQLMPRKGVAMVPMRSAERVVELGVIHSPKRATRVVHSFIDMARQQFVT